MHRALAEREHAMQLRAETVLDRAVDANHPWATKPGQPTLGRQEEWRRAGIVNAADRDRYGLVEEIAPVAIATGLSSIRRGDRAALP
jgi:hypothetical protein